MMQESLTDNLMEGVVEEAVEAVNDDIVNGYQKILVDDPDGIGAHVLSHEVMQRFAHLVDEAIKESENNCLQQSVKDSIDTSCLISIEHGVHRGCSIRIQNRYRREILKSLHQYFQSGDFSKNSTIKELVDTAMHEEFSPEGGFSIKYNGDMKSPI